MVCDERYGDQLKKGYSNTDFHAARQSKAAFVTGFEAEWASQRTLALDAPLDALLPAKEGEEAYYIAIDIQDEVRGLFVPAPRNMLMCVHFPFFFLCLCLCLCLCFSYPHPTHTTTNNTHLTHTPLSHTHTHTQWGIIDNASSFTPPTDGGGGWTQVPVNATMHGLGGWASLKLDPLTGGIVGLASSRSNQTWATPANPLGVLTYQSLTEDDYKGWRKDYLAVDCDTEYGKAS